MVPGFGPLLTNELGEHGQDPSVTFPVEPLSSIPYLDLAALGGRVLNLMPFWDGSEWHVWVSRDGGVLRLKTAGVAQTDYVAEAAAASSDLWIPFVEWVWQRASWSDIVPQIRALLDDFHNFATCADKLSTYHRFRKEIGDGTASYVVTELEYIFVLARSVFDLLYEIIRKLWDSRVRLLDQDAESRRRGRKLPESLSKVLLDGAGNPRTRDGVADRTGFPGALAQAWAEVAPFFCHVRKFRDRVVHGIGGSQTVFVTDRGFCVDPSSPAFSAFRAVLDGYKFNDRLAALTPLVAHVVFNTIASCNAVMESFGSVIRLPDPIAPSHRVFMRGYHNEALLGLKVVFEGGSPWACDEGESSS